MSYPRYRSQVLPRRPRSIALATQVYLVCEDYRVLGLGSSIVSPDTAEATVDNLANEAFCGITEGSHAVICLTAAGAPVVHALQALHVFGQLVRFLGA